MNKVIYPELSYKLIGILFAVHNEIGRFYNEKQYCDAIEKYLQLFKITHEREKKYYPFLLKMNSRDETESIS